MLTHLDEQIPMSASEQKGPRKSDKYIPLYFVAFFAVLFVMDGIFVYLATSSHTGVVEQGTYNRGLQYNERVAAAEAQDALGWQSSVQLEASGKLRFALVNADGEPLKGAQVRAQLFRPTQEGQDYTMILSEGDAGTYSGLADVAPGQWDVRIFVEWQQQQYQMAKRIIIPKQ